MERHKSQQAKLFHIYFRTHTKDPKNVIEKLKPHEKDTKSKNMYSVDILPKNMK